MNSLLIDMSVLIAEIILEHNTLDKTMSFIIILLENSFTPKFSHRYCFVFSEYSYEHLLQRIRR